MIDMLNQADGVLRALPWEQRDSSLPRRLRSLLVIVLVFGMTYGSVMGGFGGRGTQMIFSALKVPLLLLVTFAISLPSFFVLNTLFGLRADFARAAGALVAAQAGLTLILASLAPFTALWYLSFENYQSALLFNGTVFAIASIGAQAILRRLYRPLIARRPRHRTMLRFWLVLYTFVAVQMAWVLRPFVGEPSIPTSFFRTGAWSNAWEVIARLVWEALR